DLAVVGFWLGCSCCSVRGSRFFGSSSSRLMCFSGHVTNAKTILEHRNKTEKLNRSREASRARRFAFRFSAVKRGTTLRKSELPKVVFSSIFPVRKPSLLRESAAAAGCIFGSHRDASVERAVTSSLSDDRFVLECVQPGGVSARYYRPRPRRGS